jgi:hypothetical protein
MAVLTLVIPLAFRGTPLQLNLPFLGVSAALAAHYDFVADYLYGTTQFTFWVDKKTGKEAGGAWTRQTRWRKATFSSCSTSRFCYAWLPYCGTRAIVFALCGHSNRFLALARIRFHQGP